MNADELRRRLAARPRATVRLEGFRDSAVLVPILCEPGHEDALLFTVRRADLSTHAGQISFPGGKRDPDDVDAPATAIRETAEELGIEPAAVEVLGLLDDVPTPTGFVITPVVARVDGPVVLRPSADEVAAVFRAPLAQLRSPERYHHGGERSFLGVTYAMHEYHWEQHRIWGATARIVNQLLELIEGHAPPLKTA
jgi:8-oxo-dGTP pyrophosphatase MutT (NUDIX family)